jgi:hypothetical protein
MVAPLHTAALVLVRALTLTLALSFSLVASAATYYVAPTGNNSNPGTLEQPFATLARGQQAAAAGDTVYLRGGNYAFASNSAADGVLLNKSGSSGKLIKYWAYQAEIPIFDFSGMSAAARITGIRVTASWVHLKGIEVKLVPQNLTTENESWGIYNLGSNNIYEMLNLHHNMGPGFFLGGGGNNLIVNCDSHHNYDPKSKAGDGENADGFGCHPKAGDKGNVYRGIRAWWNTDDGYDSINAQEACVVEHSWAWYNGLLPDKMVEPNRNPNLPPGNGNGFKLGGFGINGTNSPAVPPKHMISFSVSFLNEFAGFFANYHTSGHFFYNNTGFRNKNADFNMLGLNMVNTSLLRNNLAFGPNPTANLTGTDSKSNSWDLLVQVSEADFQSISIAGMDAPRRADGSLPIVPFMRLLPSSDLVDKGVDIGLPFTGSAPDLGAYEAGTVVSGGASGSGGSSGTLGAGGSDTVGGLGGLPGASGGDAGSLSGGSSGGAAGLAGGSAGVNAVAGTAAAGADTTNAGAAASASGGIVTGGGAAPTAPGHPNDSGCGCRLGARSLPFGAWFGLSASLLALALGRRRAARRTTTSSRRA